MKVMVTGAGAVLGQGIIKSLRVAPHAYEIVALDPDPRAVGLYWADRADLIPLAADPGYGDAIDRVIERERPDVLLVGTDVELMYFALHKDRLESSYGVRVVVSPPDVIRIADDKWLTYQFLASNGFPCPDSALPDEHESLIQRCGFPLIVKPRIGARSIGVQRVANEQQLQEALAAVTSPIIQECVASPEHEYTSGITVVHGQVMGVVTMRRDLRDGNTYRAYVTPDSPYDELLALIAQRLGGEGVINFQFRVAEDVAKIFEINARFSGTTPFRAYAGFNEVDHLAQHYAYGTPIPKPAVAPVVILRYMNEVVIRPEQIDLLRDLRSVAGGDFAHPFTPL
jgi:carbamoyl-phosphate synthase large subunit